MSRKLSHLMHLDVIRWCEEGRWDAHPSAYMPLKRCHTFRMTWSFYKSPKPLNPQGLIAYTRTLF